MKRDPDKIIPRIILLFCAAILIYWIWNGVEWLWEWYLAVDASSETTFWQEVWTFILDNLSVVILIYGFLALQSAGLAELKFGNNFLIAFALAICLTPPIMMGAYGHRKTKTEGV